MKEIKSPKSDVAKKQVLIIEKANVLIKEKIVEAFKIGKSKEQLSKELEELIEDLGKELKEYPEVYELYIKGIRASTQRWYMLYSENIKTITNIAVTNLSKLGVPVKDISVSFSSEDKFRPYVSNNPKGLAIIEDYQKKVKQTLGTLIHDNPTSTITDKNGIVKRVSLRNQAETLVRIEANGKDVESMRASGVKLVVTTTHADCSKRCEKWQGRIFSLDGTSGVIDGKRYVPIEEAMRGVNGDGNGIISGYNCRHRAVPYKSGMVMPKEYTEAEIKRARSIDSEQRYRERTIRGLKVQERLLREQGFTKEANKTRLSWRKKQEEYKIFSLENNRSYELWRCRISDDEKEEIINAIKNQIHNNDSRILDDRIISGLGNYDNKVILTFKSLAHIYSRHPELKNKVNEIFNCVQHPDYIVKDNGSFENGLPRTDTYNILKLNDNHYIITTVKFAKKGDKLHSSIITARIQRRGSIDNKMNKGKLDIVYKKDE